MQPLLNWKSNMYLTIRVCVCVCSLSHTACNAHAACYIVLCGLSGSRMFFHIISLMEQFLKKSIEHKICVLIFTIIPSENFLILRRTKRDMIQNVYWSSCKVPIILASL